ncbi:hypothetical protein ACE2AJ_09345 [Aquihabitans daechungensis]|uniref:hypothetical protein n=1 Tax=Aquihabitans daechungensis TaxID=1052257 RepID=UPI003B9EA353
MEPPASIGAATPYALGPWVVLDDSRFGEQADGVYIRRLRVRRASDPLDTWVEVVAPLEGSIDPANAIPLAGVGLASTAGFRLNDETPTLLWRLPEELTS